MMLGENSIALRVSHAWNYSVKKSKFYQRSSFSSSSTVLVLPVVLFFSIYTKSPFFREDREEPHTESFVHVSLFLRFLRRMKDL